MVRKALLVVFGLVVALVGLRVYTLYVGYQSLTKVPQTQILGNKNGNLSVVEFLDYRCVYCREAHPTITRAVEIDRNIKYVVRPLAFINEYSSEAVKFAFAADQQGKFRQAHEALMLSEQDLTPGLIKALASNLGLNIAKLEEDMASQEAENFVETNNKVFAQIGGQSTPTFVIGHKILYVPEDRMPEVEDFLAMFEEARSLGLQ